MSSEYSESEKYQIHATTVLEEAEARYNALTVEYEAAIQALQSEKAANDSGSQELQRLNSELSDETQRSSALSEENSLLRQEVENYRVERERSLSKITFLQAEIATLQRELNARRRIHQTSSNKSLASTNDIDLTKAKVLYQKGCRYIAGREVPKKPKVALSCFMEAAELGHLHAQYTTAVCLIKGFGAEKDIFSAQRWMGLAASQGHEKALLWLPKLDKLVRESIAGRLS